MIAAVPYTRKAVQLIRNGASAVDLGWSILMYQRVCRDHGLEAVPDRTAPLPVLERRAEPPVILPKEDEVIRFDRKTGEVFFRGKVIALGPAQARIFDTLFTAHAAGDTRLIGAVEIDDAHGIRTSGCNTSGTVTRMNIKFSRVGGFEIETHKGHNGGYRLRVLA